MQQQVSLEWLVEQARRGDQRAIASLYEISYKEVYYTIHSVIADQDTALDITQDAFICVGVKNTPILYRWEMN